MAGPIDFQTRLVRIAGPGCLAGITFPDWIRLLADNRFAVDFPVCPRALLLTASSAVTSSVGFLDTLLYGRRIRDVAVTPPLFILGAWRSGTTHLHNLFCVDDRFAAPNLFQTMYPHSFLVFEPILRPLMDRFTPRKRFMDNMRMGLAEPAEDEMALGIMSLESNMLSWVFPRNASKYDNFLTFENATPRECERWKQCLDLFVRKLSVRCGKPLVLKSPNHTARIKLLLEIYPDAKFLLIHRHPFDVFRSICHMAQMVMPVWTLQRVPEERIPEIVVACCQRLFQAFFDQVGLIPSGNFHAIPYQALAENPLSELANAYQALGLPDFNVVRPQVAAYLDGQAAYKRTEHRALSPGDRERVVTAWKPAFDNWGYATE